MSYTISFDDARQRYETKYVGYKLIKYNAVTQPCMIYCPTHGFVKHVSFYSVMATVKGCTLCSSVGPKLKTEQAKKRFEEKYAGYKLLSYDGVMKPCTILCPTHGEVEFSSFNSAIKSRFGCPRCGFAFISTLNAQAAEKRRQKFISPDNPKPFAKSFAKRFISERERLNLTNEYIIKHSSITATLLNLIENGKDLIHSGHIHDLYTLNFDVLYLLTGVKSE